MIFKVVKKVLSKTCSLLASPRGHKTSRRKTIFYRVDGNLITTGSDATKILFIKVVNLNSIAQISHLIAMKQRTMIERSKITNVNLKLYNV